VTPELGAIALLLTAASPAELAQRGLKLLPSAGWSDELLEDLSLGLDALPEKARAFPGGPLEVELHPEEAPWGLGDFSDPDRLHLYAYRDDDDERAAAPLSDLSPGERRRLWRRRAVVHAVVRRWDEAQQWSAFLRWRALAGWSDGGSDRLIVYPWAFSRRAGMESPALDLATLAEEVLVPAAEGDEHPRCLQPLRSRFLDERLASVDPSWSPPRECPAFDAWARLEHLSRVEVVFSVPSGSVGQAMFGHLLLHLVRDDDDDPSAGDAVQLAALISPFEPIRSYLWRGVTGGFQGIYTLTRWGDVEHESLGLEQRALRRFALKLTAEQRVRLLERAWELQRTGYIDYRFFTANCATMLRFLLEPALDRSLKPQTPFEAPTQVLEVLAPILEAVDVEAPGGAVARRAWHRLGDLLARPPAGAPTVEKLDVEAYRALDRSLPAELEGWRADVLLASMRVERAQLDAATVARLRTEREAILPGWKGPSSEELIAARQKRSQARAADAAVALEAELAQWLALDALLRDAPRRPFSAQEQAIVDAERAARERFTEVAQAVANLPDAVLEQARERERAEEDAFTRETLERSVPESGHGHAGVGAGYSSTGWAMLRLRAAALVEELGDQRLRGFGADNEWHLLDGFVDLVPRPGAPVERADLTLLSLRLLGRPWGWGGGFGYSYAEQAHEVAGTLEGLMLVLWTPQRLTSFVYLTAALRGGLRLEPSAAGVLYPRAGLAMRLQLPGSFANCLRLEGAWRERLKLTTAGASLEHGAVGSARLTVRIGATGGYAFTARADVQLEWWLGGAVAAFGAAGIELD